MLVDTPLAVTSPDPDSTTPSPTSVGVRYVAVGIAVGLVLSTVFSALTLAGLAYINHDHMASEDGGLLSQGLAEIPELVTNPLVIVAGLLGLWAGFVGVSFWVSDRQGTGSLANDFGFRFNWLVDLPVGITLALGLRVAETGLVRLGAWFGVPSNEMSNSQILDTGTIGALVVLGLCVALGAPVAEELFFRGLTLQALSGRFGVVMGVVVSSLLFGLMHLRDFSAGGAYIVLLTALIGAAFAAVTLRMGRLGPTVVGHVAFNTSAVMVVVFT